MPMIFRQPERKTVAVNLDQTLAHTLEAMVLWHNQVYNTHLTVADFDTYEFHKVWGGSIQESHAKVREFYESSHFEQIQPIHDFALEALKMLKKRKFTLVIITSRQQFIAEETKKFVDKHYSGKLLLLFSFEELLLLLLSTQKKKKKSVNFFVKREMSNN